MHYFWRFPTDIAIITINCVKLFHELEQKTEIIQLNQYGNIINSCSCISNYNTATGKVLTSCNKYVLCICVGFKTDVL